MGRQWTGLLGAWLGVVLTPMAALALATNRPAAYPHVPLSSGAKPFYSSVAVDSDGDKVAYLCFDGNMEKGYEKMYVWIPGDPRFDKPKGIGSDPKDNNKYTPFSVNTTSKDRKEEVFITWKFRWILLKDYKIFDYTSGRELLVKRSTPYFPFEVDYVRKDKMAMSRPNAAFLDLTIPGVVDFAQWTNCPPALMPWNGLGFYGSMKPEYEKGKSRLRCKGELRHIFSYGRGGHPAVTVRSVPDTMQISFVLTPYLEPPAYSNKMSADEAFGKGIALDLPFGWYDMKWQFNSPGLNIVNQNDYWSSQTYSPHPYANPGIK